MALLLPIIELAELTSAVTLVVFALVCLALARIHAPGDPAPVGTFQVYRWVPVTGAVACLGLLTAGLLSACEAGAGLCGTIRVRTLLAPDIVEAILDGKQGPGGTATEDAGAFSGGVGRSAGLDHRIDVIGPKPPVDARKSCDAEFSKAVVRR